MLIFLVVFWKWVLNSFFIPDPFKMHHDDGLEDLLFLPSGTTNTSAFVEQIKIKHPYKVGSDSHFSDEETEV